MKLGVCYYPEHWPESRWSVDARLMRQAGLSLVRIGEFAWAKMEPFEGRFEWEWLDRIIDVLASEGLRVILGTPTAAPPAWLCRKHPEILPIDSQGHRRNFGSRRHYCPNNPVYRQYTERIVVEMAKRYGAHLAVVGWQIDNEFGCHNTARCYCAECALAFRQWLEKKYGSIEALNQAWGTVFWSQVYTDWDEIAPPFLTVTEANPSHVLDYYRFSSDANLSYQQLQIDLLRQYSPGRLITTNFMGVFPDLDYYDLARPLDLVCWDSYPTGYAEVVAESLYLPGEPHPRFAFDVGDPYVTGFCHDLTRGLKQKPFWVMEQQCGNINWSIYNTGVRPGAVRLWTWHALASGAEAVVYFRWRACLFGQEQLHGGLLGHDATPAIGYQDVCAMQDDHQAMEQVTQQPHETQVALLLNYDDLWAVGLQPHHRDFGYLRHLFVFYRALVQMGVNVDLIPQDANLSTYKLIIAPTLFLVNEKLKTRLSDYVAQGGNLLLGVRTGFKTPSNLVTDKPLPGLLRELVGVTVRQWQSLPPGIGYQLSSSIPNLEGPATFWVEALEPLQTKKGEVLLSLVKYGDGPFAGLTALSAHYLGNGRVFHLGWYPTILQARQLMGYLFEQIGLNKMPNLPESVIAIRRGPYLVLLNFNEASQEVHVDGKIISVGGRNLKLVT